MITTVDAANGAATLDAQGESVRQAAVADRLLLTKKDLVPPETADALEARLKALNSGTPVLRVVNGFVEASQLFDAGLYNPATKSVDVQRWLDAEA